MATQTGYFLIADITGYTHYLHESELDHAQQILTTLLDLLIEHTRPPLIISRLAGDAVISYALSDRFVLPQTFVETIEDTYVSFRRQIELMVRNTSCSCNACRRIADLDLKFFVHYGEFGVQKLGGHDELVGSDVNLIHRLLKNHVTERTGLGAYALYTAAAAEHLQLDPAAPGLIRLEESYEHLGEVDVLVKDMHPVWEAKRRAMQVTIPPDRQLLSASADMAVPREFVWDYLMQPTHYNALVAARRVEIEGRPGGRIGVGSTYQCYHGDRPVELVVIDWQPFERIVEQYTLPVPIPGVIGLSELRIEAPAKESTRLTMTIGRCEGPLPGRLLGDLFLALGRRSYRDKVVAFGAYMEREWRASGLSSLRSSEIPAPDVSAAARESLATIG